MVEYLNTEKNRLAVSHLYQERITVMIIKSLLDCDFYKLTMLQAVLHNYPSAWVKYEFKWRNIDKMNFKITMEDFCGRLRKEIDQLCELKFNKKEIDFIANIRYFKPDFIEYLKLFKLNRSYIKCNTSGNDLRILVEGPWVSTIMFEIYVLAIVSEIYTIQTKKEKPDFFKEGLIKLESKIEILNRLPDEKKILFADFGTRRRAGAQLHEEIVSTLAERQKGFIGTSNVLLAMNNKISPIGTMAHEWLQAHQQLGPRLIDSQKSALQIWANEYRGELGIALSDCLGFDKFLRDFDRYFALLFDGCRHDSGDPVLWCEKLIEHYKSLRIDPRTKFAVFSDGLDFNTAIDLHRRFSDKIRVSFGIGTNLTNDCGFEAPQIVMKMVECNKRPVAKISDSQGKGMCKDESFLAYLKSVIEQEAIQI